MLSIKVVWYTSKAELSDMKVSAKKAIFKGKNLLPQPTPLG